MSASSSLGWCRWAARVALVLPLIELGAVVGGNAGAAPELAVIGAVLAAVLIVVVLDRGAAFVTIRMGSERLPWVSCVLALVGAWLFVGTFTLVRAEFTAVDATGSGPFAVWAAMSAAAAVLTETGAVIVAVIATCRALAASPTITR
ncbi:hypothetical protein [Rathayibacter iranicus]|uniref:Uncharacterized protein n=2 Tax=Rathayibacter iranicus TaxID=59737 RepID=A0AAD1AFQ9_9MICO|nr:hypothetical protein [Rathayibacter iranicus]AZZ56662.1 hypothetical protein C7V51_12840 [Rathayibacter iranicus]MWV31302.1 hypothetical protein [Rathayibacter iranicus NCPPB 2253 = VKM Ac-1602]PPI43307.1 hypothetical protein C5E09_11760 [Rathayibacter iranicus]PPI58250.1 hypothetical protein C5E08_12675 [Rathayibacter iranicus]PPI69365.1 hypothetical protein C5E01_11720 [Rathayibacter iranicus]